MRKEWSNCARCNEAFSYFYETGRRPKYCAAGCREEAIADQQKSYKRRDTEKIRAIRSGTLNPRPSLQKRSSIADCTGVLVPPSQIPANDFAWVLEPPLPKQSWVFEVGGVTLNRLSEAEEEAKHTGFPIYCRPKNAAQKAAS